MSNITVQLYNMSYIQWRIAKNKLGICYIMVIIIDSLVSTYKTKNSRFYNVW